MREDDIYYDSSLLNLLEFQVTLILSPVLHKINLPLQSACLYKSLTRTKGQINRLVKTQKYTLPWMDDYSPCVWIQVFRFSFSFPRPLVVYRVVNCHCESQLRLSGLIHRMQLVYYIWLSTIQNSIVFTSNFLSRRLESETKKCKKNVETQLLLNRIRWICWELDFTSTNWIHID